MIIKIQVSEERNMCQLRLLVQEKAHGFQSNQMLKSRLHNFEQFIYVSQTRVTHTPGDTWLLALAVQSHIVNMMHMVLLADLNVN